MSRGKARNVFIYRLQHEAHQSKTIFIIQKIKRKVTVIAPSQPQNKKYLKYDRNDRKSYFKVFTENKIEKKLCFYVFVHTQNTNTYGILKVEIFVRLSRHITKN